MGIGQFVGDLGHTLHLPELGISEKLGGSNPYTYTTKAGLQVIGQTDLPTSAFATQLYPQLEAQYGNQTAPGAAKNTDTSAPEVLGTSTSGTAASPNYDFLVDDQLGRLDNQQAVGSGNILGAYNSAFQTLTNQKDTTNRNFDIQSDQTQQDNVKAKNSIDQGVRANVTALSRLLGGKGAGNSSAATILAPFAAGVQGNTQRADVQDTYGRNMSAIDLAKKDANSQFDTSFGQLDTDKVNQQNALAAKIADTRAQLLAAKGDPALQSKIADLGKQVDALGAVATFTPKAVTAAAPDLGAYNYETAAPDAAGNLTGGEDGSLPGVGAYSTLLGLTKKKTPALAGATA